MSVVESNFGTPLVVALIAALLTTVLAALAIVRIRPVGHAVRVASRVIAAGGALTVLFATALPDAPFSQIDRSGDLVLRPGGAGLAEWRVLATDPTSLASFLLVLNVVAYVPVGLFGALGWPGHSVVVTAACIAFSVCVELLQFAVLGRVGALDDVILNAVGALLGVFAGTLVARRLT